MRIMRKPRIREEMTVTRIPVIPAAVRTATSTVAMYNVR